MAKAKSPRVDALRQELEARKAELEAELKPHREAYERLVNHPDLLKAKAKIRELNPKLAEVQNELAALARSKGSKGIKAEPGQYSSEVK